MPTIKDVAQALEAFAPLPYQESYDNSGLQLGLPGTEVSGVLTTLDVTEAVVDEALEKGCNLIVAHHPVIFGGLKRLTGSGYVERILLKAIRADVAIYAAHTNLDNARAGVNAVIADKLGLGNTSILQAMGGTLRKLHTYAPAGAADRVREAMFAAGAGRIGEYSECSFQTPGTGTFRPSERANPAVGRAGGPREEAAEVKIEVLVPQHLEGGVLKALRAAHPYEEVAYEMVALQNSNQDLGAGVIGSLPEAMEEADFLSLVKMALQTDCIRHTALGGKQIRKVALCGGSGSFLLKAALAAGADAFVTADYKYHQFFDADGRILIADIGHYESEQFTPLLLRKILRDNFPNFAVLLSGVNTNPVKYFI